MTAGPRGGPWTEQLDQLVDAGPQCDVWQQLVKEQPKDQPGEWSKLTSFSNASSRLFKK